MTRPSLIAVDWGSTNRRAYAIGADGRVLARLADDRGVLSIAPGEFPAQIDHLRERLGSAPMLLAGMIGSNRGWISAPYVACPAGGGSLAAAMLAVDGQHARIVPGLSFVDEERSDVMRGEEVQFFGLLRDRGHADLRSLCHPGTHAKWAIAADGEILSFRTVMTGELFALLRTQSILADQLAGEVGADESFDRGVRAGFERGEISADLFGVRADAMLGRDGGLGASYVSGLLIGLDLRIGLNFVGNAETIGVVGDQALTALYCRALSLVGRDTVEIDGEAAFVAGMLALAEALQ